MAHYNNNIPALFIHIPKCYGISIRTLLENYGFINLDIKEYSKIDGTLTQILKLYPFIDIHKTFIFTFIREPTTRFISGCNYMSIDTDFVTNQYKINKLKRVYYWHTLMPQVKHLYKNNNETCLKHINFIGICENFTNDWETLSNILLDKGLSKPLDNIPWENKSIKKNKKILDSKITHFINDWFIDDINIYKCEYDKL